MKRIFNPRYLNTKPLKDYTKMVSISETCKISLAIKDIKQIESLKSFGAHEESIGSY